MSFLRDFEGRISSVFDAAPHGYDAPFSFKKLAKHAAREMENETYEIDGVDTAPALYTVLVSAQDDSVMRPLYSQITYETASFVTAQAQKKGYAFVGNPLVRFMVDPSLKSGKFAVFAENVDSVTLERLRAEEKAFLGENSSVGGAAAQVHRSSHAAGRGGAHTMKPIAQPIATPAASMPAVAAVAAVPAVTSPQDSGLGLNLDAGLDVMPAEFDEPMAVPVATASESTPMPVASAPFVAPAPTPLEPPQPVSIPVPQTQLRNVPLAGSAAAAAPAAAAAASSQPAQSNQPAACILIDRQSGRTYTAQAPEAVIGRERSQSQIVLRDPNVSRAHARLTFNGRDWRIQDLGSTNGTLVNDVDVSECALRDGDLITVGLVNLEFRENFR